MEERKEGFSFISSSISIERSSIEKVDLEVDGEGSNGIILLLFDLFGLEMGVEEVEGDGVIGVESGGDFIGEEMPSFSFFIASIFAFAFSNHIIFSSLSNFV